MTDSFFGAAWTDVDEWRDTPVPHRYVHGGFAGTDTRFSFYFPPPQQWQGRLLQTLEGGNGGHEHTAQSGVGTMGGIAFAAESGAYLVESNQGHIGSDLSIMFSEPTVHAYRASAQSARYSKPSRTKVTAPSTVRSKYLATAPAMRCSTCVRKADPMSICFPVMFNSMLFASRFERKNASRIESRKRCFSRKAAGV